MTLPDDWRILAVEINLNWRLEFPSLLDPHSDTVPQQHDDDDDGDYN